MEEIKLNLEAIRAQMNLSRAEMADKLMISLDRYNRLANGDSKMLATELIRLHKVSGMPYENILVTGA